MRKNRTNEVQRAINRRRMLQHHYLRQVAVVEVARDRIEQELAHAEAQIAADEAEGHDLSRLRDEVAGLRDQLVDIDRQIAERRAEAGLPPRTVTPEIAGHLEQIGL